MSKANKNDEINTKIQLKNFNPITTNRTWLGHFANMESGSIDIMVLEGNCSIDEMVLQLKSNPNFKIKNESQWKTRISNHLLHISTLDGDSRNRSEGLQCHNLKLKENESGKIVFDY